MPTDGRGVERRRVARIFGAERCVSGKSQTASISTKILPKRLLDTTFSRAPVSLRVRLIAGSTGRRTGRTHFNDFMLASTSVRHVQEYSKGARQFVRILGRSLNEAGRSWNDIGSVLEIGCGMGASSGSFDHSSRSWDICANDVIEEGRASRRRSSTSERFPLLEAAPSLASTGSTS
jgi:hypothetical protein